MIYAPGVTNADIGINMDVYKRHPSLPLVYAGYSGGARTAYIIVLAAEDNICFEDGTSAEQTTPTFEHPRIGRAYTLFLVQEAAVPSVFFLSGGPQGMFDLEDSAGVKSHGLPEQPSVVETKGKDRESFMKNVRE